MPQEIVQRREVFVTVTAPAGTVHEAFFDPVAIGTAVGADGTNGVLKPTAFSVGGVSTALQTLKWETGTLTLGLSSAASLTGHALDFIALDGSVALSLAGGATAAASHTWSVADQPWQAGELLMLRIRTGSPTATATATPVPATATATAVPGTATATPVNEAPVFGSDSYSFSVAETKSRYSVIGTVAATDEDGDAVTHHITAGNGSGTFRIDLNDGFILLWKALDYETTTSYTLTVEARDGNGGVDTATVTITVTDVEGS